MLGEKMEKALNEQINAELFSEYLYLSMSACFESINLPGFAQWMRVQAAEEDAHGMRIYDYIHERGGRVILTALDGPQTEWDSVLAAFEAAYEHECMITGRINDLVALAEEEKDYATRSFLQWFVDEQVEEESSVLTVVDQLKMIGDQPGVLFMLDQKMAARQPAPAAGAGEEAGG